MARAADEGGPFSELTRSVRLLGRLTLAKPSAMVVASVGSMLAPTIVCAGLGLLLVPAFVGRALAEMHRTFAPKTDPNGPVVALAIVLSFGVPAVAVLALVPTTWTGSASLLVVFGVILGASCAGAVQGLLAGVTYHALAGKSLVDATTDALADATRVGLAPRAIAGALQSVSIIAPVVLLVQYAGSLGSYRWGLYESYVWILAVPFLHGVGIVWTFALGAPAVVTAARPTAGRAMSGLLRIAAVVVLATWGALVWAAARPSEAHSVPTAAEASRGTPLDRGVDLRGPHGLRVETSHRGLSITAADGGGAGFVEMPGCRAGTVAYTSTSDSEWMVYGHCVARRWGSPDIVGVRFDERGVRTDDGLLDRIGARFGLLGMLLLLVAVVLGVPLVLVLARGFGGAALLDAGDGPGPWTVWRGTLELDEGTELRVERGRVVTHGSARVVSSKDQAVTTLASGARVLGSDPIAAGSPVAIVLPTGSARSLGPRTGALTWPDDAWLVSGSLDSARARIVELALRRAALYGVPASLAALAAAGVSLMAS